MGYQNTNCRRGLSLFGCAENILNKVHIVQCGHQYVSRDSRDSRDWNKKLHFVGGGARGPPDVTKNGRKWFRVYLV